MSIETRRFKRKWLLLVILLSVTAILAVWVLARRAAPPPPVMELSAQQLQANPSFWQRWVPRPVWVGLWRLKSTVAGHPREVDLSANALEFVAGWGREVRQGSLWAAQSLGQPDFAGTNGLHVWLLPAAKLKALQEQLNQLPGFVPHDSRITTADGSQAGVFLGSSVVIAGVTNQAGMAALFLPHVRGETLDLKTALSFSEPVPGASSASSMAALRTNFEAAFRLQLPRDSGAFLLQTNPTAGKYYGFILSVHLPPKGKNL